ncbi:MAG: hypothetical protein ABFD51_06995 [Anaerolineaceae bacterium]
MMPCPVQAWQLQAISLGSHMLSSLKHLRREIVACQTCIHANDCPARDELNAQIETAIREIIAEWGFAN